MSRCFPFPPPGYEKRTRSERVDLLEKEKHKEKKRKKEKRDKEKKEGKEKRDKNQGNDKQKEKKDRKEKHREKKKDKDGHKDKSKTSEERNKKQIENHHEERFRESRIAEGIKGSKFLEELDRRIREENGAANQLPEDFSTLERSLEDFSAAPAMEKKNVTDNKMFPNSINAHLERSLDDLRVLPATETEKITVDKMVPGSINTARRRNDEVRQEINNASNSVQKRTEGLGSETTMQKERVTKTVTTGQRGNGGAGQSSQIPTGSTQRKPSSATEAGTGRGMHNKIITNSGSAVQRTNDGMDRPAERFSSSIQRKIGGLGPTTATGKENENGKSEDKPKERNELKDNIRRNVNTKPLIDKDDGENAGSDGSIKKKMLLLVEHGQNDAIAQYIEKNAGRTIEGRETSKERETDEGRRERSSNRHQGEKKKRKDKHKHKNKKKEEKIKEKSEDKPKERNELKDNIRRNVNTKPLVDNDDGENAGSDENIKKRKDFETNGLFHEHDMRPTKFPRMTAPSNLPVENGCTLLPYHVAAPCSSVKPDATFNVKAEKLLDNKEKKITGVPKVQQPPAESKLPASVVVSGNGEFSMRPPHPDSKYLTQVYSVPKMEEQPEPDDQEWLFIRGQLHPKPETKLEADGTPQVWDKALHFEAADVFALPYVIPF